MAEVKLKRIEYSENVIRKSLYWISEDLSWTLSEIEDFWIINFSGHDIDSGVRKFYMILNDFILREHHDMLTLDVRRELIKSALVGVWRKLDDS